MEGGLRAPTLACKGMRTRLNVHAEIRRRASFNEAGIWDRRSVCAMAPKFAKAEARWSVRFRDTVSRERAADAA